MSTFIKFGNDKITLENIISYSEETYEYLSEENRAKKKEAIKKHYKEQPLSTRAFYTVLFPLKPLYKSLDKYEAVQELKDKRRSLIVTVKNGSKRPKRIRYIDGVNGFDIDETLGQLESNKK